MAHMTEPRLGQRGQTAGRERALHEQWQGNQPDLGNDWRLGSGLRADQEGLMLSSTGIWVRQRGIGTVTGEFSAGSCFDKMCILERPHFIISYKYL